jgi:hypothetical protein
MLCLRNIVDSESATETQYEDARGSFESNIHKPSTKFKICWRGSNEGHSATFHFQKVSLL